MELIDSNKSGSDHSPQGELLDRADRYARNLILGQTMTGSHGTTGKGGGQAFGEVEADVKSDRIDAAGSFAAEIINNQLIKFVLQFNYGDSEEMPRVKFLEDDVAGLPQAQTYKTLADAGTEIGVDHIRKVFDIPEPAEGEDTIGGPKQQPDFGQFGGSFGADQTGAQPDNTGEPPPDEPAKAGDQPGHEFHGNQYTKVPPAPRRFGEFSTYKGCRIEKTERGEYKIIGMGTGWKYEQKYRKAIARIDAYRASQTKSNALSTSPTGSALESSDQTGHPFRGNQYVSLGSMVETPHGRGTVVANDNGGAWVSVNGAIRKYKYGEIKRAMKPFPSLLPSEENKRRLMRNAGLQTKLLELNAIEDDAIFATELGKLAEETCQQEQK